jgi:hypothetical protein
MHTHVCTFTPCVQTFNRHWVRVSINTKVRDSPFGILVKNRAQVSALHASTRARTHTHTVGMTTDWTTANMRLYVHIYMYMYLCIHIKCSQHLQT